MSRATRLRAMDSSFVAVPRVADYTTKRVRWVTRALIALVVVLFIGSIAVLAKGSPSPTAVPRYQEFATIAAGDWLQGRTLSVPAVAGLSNTAGSTTPFSTFASPNSGQADSVAGQSKTTGTPAFSLVSVGFSHFERTSQGKQPYSEVDHFTLQTTSGYYDLAIPVVDASGEPVLAGLPTLSVTGFPGRKNVHQAVPAGWLSKGLTSGETSQVKQWAQAYVTGNGQSLYELTGDSRATHYLGLGARQWTLDGAPSVVGSWANKKANTEVARVELTVTMKDQTFGTSYDVLFGDVSNRALPPIQAWGPTGSGFTLRPYQNAIQGATGS